MKFKQFFIPNMTTVALLIAGLSADLEHVSALETIQNQIYKLSEVKKMLEGQPSSMEVEDVIKDINEGKLNCTAPILPDRESLIVYAFAYKNKDVIKACVSQCIIFGNSLGYIDPSRRTILHIAALSASEMLRMVLDDLPQWDALLNVQDSEDNTPIARAVLGFKAENVQILKEAGADLTLKVLDGWTPLEWARYHRLEWARYHRQQITSEDAEFQKNLDENINILSHGATIKL